jgi:glutamine phosphoribosylpyrophosphate amidotransferase
MYFICSSIFKHSDNTFTCCSSYNRVINYGIDVSTTAELISASKSPEEICEYIGADSLAYLTIRPSTLKYARESAPIYSQISSGDLLAEINSAVVVKMLKDAGANKIHVRIASPEFMFPSFYGIDVSTT